MIIKFANNTTIRNHIYYQFSHLDEIMMYLGNSWLMAVKNSITKQQFEPIWMLEDKVSYSLEHNSSII